MYNNLLLHIPHSSTYIPEEMKDLFVIDRKELDRELLVMTDRYTDELFDFAENRIVFPFSRLICDVERFRDRTQETMTEKGMWICYERTSGKTPLKDITPEHTSYVLESCYDPHHKQFTDAATGIRDTAGSVMIIDCHSFSSRSLPYEDDRDPDRPDICIGTDGFHTPPSVITALRNAFTEMGYSVKLNSPYSGCIVPMDFWIKDPSVKSVMIEVNRSTYMDEATGRKLKCFNTVRRHIEEAVYRCTESFMYETKTA